MNNILSALEKIDVSSLSYQEWVNVGMALQSEDYSWEVWDNWSRNDKRYKKGECERKWRTFKGAVTPITGATIVQMAKERGWTPFENNGIMDWSDTISYDGDDFTAYSTTQEHFNPVAELKRYLSLLFDKDDLVSYVTESWEDSDGKWKPSSKGYYDRTAGQLIASLDKYPNDLGATIGDWHKEAGAWIRFNPVSGAGVKNEHITKFNYALVESDSMSIADQDAMYRKLELPIVCLVHSGGKSLHAIVKVDADVMTNTVSV